MSLSSFLQNQKARFQNVGAVYASIFKGEGTTANVKNPALKKTLEATTKNPLTVAGTALAAASVTFAAKKVVTGIIAKKAATKAAAAVIKPAGTGGIVTKAATTLKPKPTISEVLQKAQQAKGIIGGAKDILGNRSQPTTINPSLQDNPTIQSLTGDTTTESRIYESSGALPSVVLGENISDSGITNTINQVSSLSSGLSSFKSTSPKSRKSYSRKRKSKKSPRRSKKRASKSKRKGKKKRYGTAKQYKRKGGRSVKYTKNGQPYIILANGRARFVKGKRKK